jgi:uncharacterized caspase-like protein
MSTMRRLVLSVGIGAYNKRYLQPLYGPVQDALSMAQTAALTPGFNTGDVTFKEDLSCRDLHLELLKMQSEITKKAEEVDMVLTYLSGQLLRVAGPLIFCFSCCTQQPTCLQACDVQRQLVF